LFAPLFANLTAEKRTAAQSFNPGIAPLYSKAWSAALLRRLLRAQADTKVEIPPWLCGENEVGVAVNSLAEALAAVAAIRARGHHKIVVKAALGLAGSNALRLFEPEILESQRRWMTNVLSGGNELVVEPWLEREVDFSVQLEMTADDLRLCGYTGLINDAKGQFQANHAAPGYQKKIPARVLACFPEPADIANRCHHLFAEIFASLETELRRVHYLGPAGIDAFVYRAADGRCRLKPIVEINPRYTMGRLTLELMRQTAQGSHGRFQLVNPAKLRAEKCDSFAAYARALKQQFPLHLTDEPAPRIHEGALCLNDPLRARACLATFQVTRS
jgi:hypothetical protein